MILSDRDIKDRCHQELPLIEPFHEHNLQPASVDLCLGSRFIQYIDPALQHHAGIDLAHIHEHAGPQSYRVIDETKRFRLPPKGFALGQTKEWVNIPFDIVGQIEGKSSLARLGLIVHVTAGFCDPGFSGVVTLEFFNCNTRPIHLRPGRPICQIAFAQLTSPAEHPYGSAQLQSHYQLQSETTASRG